VVSPFTSTALTADEFGAAVADPRSVDPHDARHTTSTDTTAQNGAQAGRDPPYPTNPSYLGGGSILWKTRSPLVAIWGWMYDDGPGGGNFGCPRTGGGDCWAHRNLAVLLPQSPLVGGGGHTGANTTFLILAISPSSEPSFSFVFSWSSELRFFAHPPGPEPKGR
jgi:hypothetical protein